jgi:flagellar basal-body rod protein FlgB
VFGFFWRKRRILADSVEQCKIILLPYFASGGITVLNSGAIYLLERALDAAAVRQRTIAHNIANVNTPGFKRSQISFGEELRARLRSGISLQRTHPLHLPMGGNELAITISQDNSTGMRSDGNNVDIDREMVELAQNSLDYQFATNQLSGRLDMFRYVINEGRR